MNKKKHPAGAQASAPHYSPPPPIYFLPGALVREVTRPMVSTPTWLMPSTTHTVPLNSGL